MHTFTIRNNKRFCIYAANAYKYFIKRKYDGVKITIRKNDVFIHISEYYCVILNDLTYISRSESHNLECSKKALKWLKEYNKN